MANAAAALHVSTALVAKALGVSVSTVKRWVDDGVLPAQKTAGGHRKLLIADVLEFVRRSEFPRADLSRLMGPGRGSARGDPAPLSDELHAALVEGDHVLVRSLILGGYRRGMAIEQLADQLVHPAMERIGKDWETGRIDVMEEHRASQLCASVLYELKVLLEQRASRNRPRAVGGAPEHDESVLPSLMAQMVLLDCGWEAVNLGPRTPFKSFEKALVELKPKLIWLSVSHLGPQEEFIAGFTALYQAASKQGVAVAIGGHAMAENVRSRIPYTTYGDGLSHLAAFARSLHPLPKRPRRGRPVSDAW